MPDLTPEMARAQQLAQELRDDIAKAIDSVVQKRFQPVFDGHLNVLRERVHKVFSDPSKPPAMAAHAEYIVFSDSVAELKPKMNAELRVLLIDILGLADRFGIRAEVDQSITMRVDDFLVNLLTHGAKIMAGYVEAIHSADEAWRQNNPEGAARFPKD